MENKVSRRVWVIPAGATWRGNDGEMMEIAELLHESGEMMFVTAQGWGASWDKANNILGALRRMAEDGATIYGVELAGEPDFHVVNIDHHCYGNDTSRCNDRSSLEQVAEILGVELTRRQKGVAICDVLYIPGLIAAGYTKEEIADIRRQDRFAQGITEADEEAAKEALSCPDLWSRGNGEIFAVYRLAHNHCACITDADYDEFREGGKLILCRTADGMGELDFYGKRADCEALRVKFGGWSGGGQADGFWGIGNGLLQTDVIEWLERN